MISFIDLFWACLLLGLPLTAFSWLVFAWLFSHSEVDRKADDKTLNASLKQLRKQKARQKGARSKAEFVYDKWMWFGSGFYGLAGVWTFAVIEIRQFFGFLLDYRSWAQLFDDGLVGLLIDFLLNQLMNMLQGLLWFSYWPAESILLWVLVAYLGYWVGIELARRSVVLPLPAWLQALELDSSPQSWWQRLRHRLAKAAGASSRGKEDSDGAD